MKDGVIAGTGNSRFLKSGITEETTWEQFRAALVAGNLPIDMNGANPDGWTQMGSAISKSNLLPDALATLLGLSLGDDPQIKDALGALYAAASAAAKAEIGTYTGTGTYGALNKNSITFGALPKVIFISSITASKFSGFGVIFPSQSLGLIMTTENVEPTTTQSGAAQIVYVAVSLTETTVSWNTTSTKPRYQLNESGCEYSYIGIVGG